MSNLIDDMFEVEQNSTFRHANFLLPLIILSDGEDESESWVNEFLEDLRKTPTASIYHCLEIAVLNSISGREHISFLKMPDISQLLPINSPCQDMVEDVQTAARILLHEKNLIVSAGISSLTPHLLYITCQNFLHTVSAVSTAFSCEACGQSELIVIGLEKDIQAAYFHQKRLIFRIDGPEKLKQYVDDFITFKAIFKGFPGLLARDFPALPASPRWRNLTELEISINNTYEDEKHT